MIETMLILGLIAFAACVTSKESKQNRESQGGDVERRRSSIPSSSSYASGKENSRGASGRSSSRGTPGLPNSSKYRGK
nr:hypothetical protein [uncultured Dethiosulfovibrio sp.]